MEAPPGKLADIVSEDSMAAAKGVAMVLPNWKAQGTTVSGPANDLCWCSSGTVILGITESHIALKVKRIYQYYRYNSRLK